jgi:rRNA-processing protein FCF1
MNQKSPLSFLLDANVIIDFQNAMKPDIFSALKRVSTIFIVDQARKKVRGLTPSICKKLGLKTLTPDFDEVVFSAELKKQTIQLAEDDALTLALGIKRNHIVITNDRRMIETGLSRNLIVKREFYLLIYLFERQILDKTECIEIAKNVIATNKWMAANLLEDLEIKLANAAFAAEKKAK